MKDSRIRVLVVEAPNRGLASLARLLERDPRLQAAGPVSEPEAIYERVRGSRPAVVLVDSQLAGMAVFETIRVLMESHPVPIVVCAGGAAAKDQALMSRVMGSGAVALVERPGEGTGPDADQCAQALLDTLRLMSEVKVVRRTRRASLPARRVPSVSGAPPREAAAPKVEAIAIGASTGGPPVLKDILARLPGDFPVPIFIVQHIAGGFLAAMAEWLRESAALPIQIAAHGMQALPGHVYLAPDHFHMEVAAGGTIVLTEEAPVHHVRPAVSVLFRSMANVHGAQAVGVLLTGMGKDGAAEMKRMRDLGAATIAQDRESSTVHGMPGAAIAEGGAGQVLPPHAIAAALVDLAFGRVQGGEK